MYDPATTTWRVTSQSPRTEVGPTNNLIDGYNVTFTTGEGHVGTVFVPNSRYTPDGVKAAIQPIAETLDAVGALTQDS